MAQYHRLTGATHSMPWLACAHLRHKCTPHTLTLLKQHATLIELAPVQAAAASTFITRAIRGGSDESAQKDTRMKQL